jgi:hypothetical protein
MKKSGIAILCFLLMGLSSAGTLTYGGDAVSRYIWRGADLGDPVSYEEPTEWQNNTPAIQPGVTYTFDNNISIGLWGSYGIGKNGSNEIDELDYLAGYTFSFKDVDYKLGYTHYTFPSYEKLATRQGPLVESFFSKKDIDASIDSDEVAIGATFSKLFLSPSLTVYHDFDRSRLGAMSDPQQKGADLSIYTYTELGLVFPELVYGIANSVTLGFDSTSRVNGALTNINYKLSKGIADGFTGYTNLIYLTGAKGSAGFISSKDPDGKRDPFNNDSYEVVFGVNYTGSTKL